jgi:hypothetical protein
MYQVAFQILAKCLLAVLFIYSSIIKLLHHDTFVLDIARSPLIPNEIVSTVSLLIPFIEIFIVAALLFQKTMLLGLYSSLFLMLSFTLYLITLTSFFGNIPCACGGILGGMSYPVHIAFNIFFTLVALVGIYTSEDTSTSEPQAA